MVRPLWQIAILLSLLSGCRSAQVAMHLTETAPAPVTASDDDNQADVRPVDYQQPPKVGLGDGAGEVVPLGESAQEASPLSLADLQQRARQSNPAIAEAAMQVEALRGKWVQVGLPPNPTAGYLGGEIGNDGQEGQQGMFAGQELVTAQKLQRNRAIVAAEIRRAQQVLSATVERVETDVRVAYYRALAAQQQVEVTSHLVRVASEATKTSQRLLDIEEIPLSSLLQSEVQEQQSRLALRIAENKRQAAWRTLSAVVGGPPIPPQPLAGDVTELPPPLGWENELARVAAESPELAAAMASVDRARRVLSRESVAAVPNIQTQLSVQYDASSDDTIAGVQVGVPLPLWDRNQGGIRQARAQIAQARRNVDRVELGLAQRLAAVYQDYADALAQAETYADDILPRAERTFEMVERAYREAGEVSYLEMLTAQRTYAEAYVSYLDAVGAVWENWAKIRGLLLDGSLGTDIALGFSGGVE